ncbi:MAG: nucleoside-diphosphate kinase [Clostridia bacterium]|jgi:nucleoside-diphosphate kinase|nr:nucleoside-diphosphate kinase [Clostridia bacterium]
MEKTYVMLKPEALKRNIMGDIISRIERKGLKVSHVKTMMLSEELVNEHYAHITSKPFYPEILENMTSGPVLAMVVEGQNAIEAMMILCGPTQWNECVPGTIRGDYVLDTGFNVIHRSDSEETAEIELKRFFPELS